MADNNLGAELAVLKMQLQKLEQNRTPSTPPTPQSETVATPQASAPDLVASKTDEEDDDWLEGLQNLDPEQVLERLKTAAAEWFDEFNSELKDARPSTVLTIFGLGVVIGRLTQ